MATVSTLPHRPSGVWHTLPSGSVVVLRPLEPEDGNLLREIFDGMGPRSR